MKEQTSAYLEKSRDLLGHADTMMGAGLTDDASGAWPPYSDPIRAPFSATERFISSTTNTSATMTTASTQNTSK